MTIVNALFCAFKSEISFPERIDLEEGLRFTMIEQSVICCLTRYAGRKTP